MTHRPSWWLSAAVLVLVPRISIAEPAEASREDRVRQAEATFASEPAVEEVREAALRFFSVGSDALGRVRRGARSRAGAPVVILSTRYDGVRSNRRIQDTTTVTNARDRFDSDGATGLATLSWNFPEGVFSPAELQVYPLDEMQRIVLRNINNWYYLRRQLLLALIVDPPEDDRALHALRIRVRGFTALLNAYTGGWFGEHLPEGSI
jgi:hypothetical protein